MPGLFTFVSENSNDVNSYKASSSCVEHGDPLEKNIIIDAGEVFSFVMSHACYPCRKLQRAGTESVIVGRIYNICDVELYDIMNSFMVLFESGFSNALENSLREFINRADGDFILQIFRKPNELLIVTDFLGRIPLYYRETEDFLVLGTEIKSLFLKNETIEITRIGLCEYLLYEYNVGMSTLYRDVYKLGGGSILLSSGAGHSIVALSSDELNFRGGDPSFYSKFVRLLEKSAKDRYSSLEEYSDIRCDISGGLDSRVIACLLRKYPNVNYQTFQYTSDESGIAKKVLSKLHRDSPVNHNRYMHDGYSNTLSESVWLGDGLVNSISSSICHEDLLATYEIRKTPYVRFTGLGASDFIRKFPFSLMPIFDLVNGRGHRYGVHANIDSILKLTSVTESVLKERWMTHLLIYTSNLRSKETLRYLYLDFQKNYVLLSAEERERVFCWTVPIMYSSTVIKYVFNHFDPSQASYYQFRKFLSLLDKNMLAIPLHGRRVSIGSKLEALSYDLYNEIRHFRAKYLSARLSTSSASNEGLNDKIIKRILGYSILRNWKLNHRFLSSLTNIQLLRLETLLIYFGLLHARLGVNVVLEPFRE